MVIVGAFTFIDAWTAGIYKIKDKKTFINMSPMAWAIAMEGVLIVTLPIYVLNRNKLRTTNGNTAWFVLTILSGAIPLILTIFNIALETNHP